MRCSKSCYLCDLGIVALFDVVEQGVFVWNDFLIDRTAEFCFHVAACPVSFSPADEYTDIYLKYCRSQCQRAASRNSSVKYGAYRTGCLVCNVG